MTTTTKQYESTSGLKAADYKVFIKPDKLDEVTAGGIIKPQQLADRDQWAQVKGTIDTVGGKAFSDWHPAEREAMVPGTRVYYSKYEGVTIPGRDGVEYRLLNDKNIGAFVLDEAAIPSHLVKGRTAGGLGAA